LNEVSTGVQIRDERLKPINHPHDSAFALYQVREDLAEQSNCETKLGNAEVSAEALKSKNFGKYVGAVFKLGRKDRKGETVATLWRKERGYWTMISYMLGPHIDETGVPHLETQTTTAKPLEQVAGDKDMVAAATEFLTQWLVKRNATKALDYLAPQCMACVKLYADENDSAQAASPREHLRTALSSSAVTIGAKGSLQSAIAAAEPHHEHLKLVKHANDTAFVIVSIPEYMADAADCEKRKPGEDLDAGKAEPAGYGRYYATGFGRRVASGGILWIVWGKVDGRWKAVSYALIHP
jgi:hypothetical protein